MRATKPITRTRRILYHILWYLLWPLAGLFDLLRRRAPDVPCWITGVFIGMFFATVILGFLVLVPFPTSLMPTTLVFFIYLVLGHGFRMDVRRYDLWEF